MRALAFALVPTLAAVSALAQPARSAGPAHEPAARHVEARPRAGAVPREAVEALEAQLDRAVARVSLPRAAHLLGAGSARGYRLPGYGIVFVLTPRALPGSEDRLLRFAAPERMKLRRARPSGGSELAPEIDALERQVIVLQQETELTRRAAEVEMDRIVQHVRVRLAAPGEEVHVVHAGPQGVSLAPPAQAPEAVPAPPLPPPAPPAPANAPEAPAAAVPPTPAEAPPPPPAPWRYWFETRVSHDERTPDAVVADVRGALIDALAGQAGRLPGLGPDEFVAVAVDFEAGGLIASHASPERTLVVRARVRDLEARARGAIPAQELRRRVEVAEY